MTDPKPDLVWEHCLETLRTEFGMDEEVVAGLDCAHASAIRAAEQAATERERQKWLDADKLERNPPLERLLPDTEERVAFSEHNQRGAEREQQRSAGEILQKALPSITESVDRDWCAALRVEPTKPDGTLKTREEVVAEVPAPSVLDAASLALGRERQRAERLEAALRRNGLGWVAERALRGEG